MVKYLVILLAGLLFCVAWPQQLDADGIVKGPRNYAGSLAETSQEAIIVFELGQQGQPSRQSLVLKIQVESDQPLDQLAWIVPFPAEPEVAPASPQLFKELFDYVEARKQQLRPRSLLEAKSAADGSLQMDAELLSRQIVGSYDVAVLRENKAGGLNGWLSENDFQVLENADAALGFYRDKRYVFACIKFDQAQLDGSGPTDLHPLEFRFSTGGQDGIYFPMKLTSLQQSSVDINLYIFYRYWLNDDLNRFGYLHRGFEINYRDWDSPDCVPNGGKSYTAPQADPFLRNEARLFPSVTRFLQARHSGQRFYLTNIQAFNVTPAEIGRWKDDLWLFPHYSNRRKIPEDVRGNGPASGGWERLDAADGLLPILASDVGNRGLLVGVLLLTVFAGSLVGFWFNRRRKNRQPEGGAE